MSRRSSRHRPPHLLNLLCFAVSLAFWQLANRAARLRECMVMNGTHANEGIVAFVVEHRLGLFVAATTVTQLAHLATVITHRRPATGAFAQSSPRIASTLAPAWMVGNALAWLLLWAAVISELVMAQHGLH